MPYFCFPPLTPLISGAAVPARVNVDSCPLTSQAGKLALSEDATWRMEDTVSWKGHKGKSELEKHSRELEGRRMRREGLE